MNNSRLEFLIFCEIIRWVCCMENISRIDDLWVDSDEDMKKLFYKFNMEGK